MGKQVVVVGLGRFGISLADTLHSLGDDVLALDRNVDTVQRAASFVTHAVQSDATSEAGLREMGIGNFDIAIVAIGTDIQNSVLTTILLKQLGVPHVIARANNDLHGEILAMIGADKVIYPEHEMGKRIGHEATLGSHIAEYMSVAPGYGIAKVKAKPGFAGHSLSDLGISRPGYTGIYLLLIQRGKEVIVFPSNTQAIEAGDVLIISGSDELIGDFMVKAKSNTEKVKIAAAASV